MSIFSTIFTRDEINIPLPDALHTVQPYTYLVYSLAIILLLSFVLKPFKILPNFKKGIIAALSILIMYLTCLVIYTYEPAGLQEYLVPLPFIRLDQKSLSVVLYKFTDAGTVDIRSFSSQVASMFLLAFLVNQVYAFKPGNLKSPGWLVFRFLSTIICIGVHYAAYKILQKCIGIVPKGGFIETLLPYVPIGLLFLLVLTFIIGLFKRIMSFFFKKVNPTFEGLHGFYFVNKFGVVMTRAICTTLILTVFTYGLQQAMEEANQIASISIAAPPGLSGTIILLVLFLVWMFLGQSL